MENQYNGNKSGQYFHIKPDNLNCAQAILKGYQKEFNITDQEIEDYRAWGGGRATAGICGALFSAEKLLSQAGKAGITEEFKSIVGEIQCIEIKKKKVTCIDCVRIAEDLMEKKLK